MGDLRKLNRPMRVARHASDYAALIGGTSYTQLQILGSLELVAGEDPLIDLGKCELATGSVEDDAVVKVLIFRQ